MLFPLSSVPPAGGWRSTLRGLLADGICFFGPSRIDKCLSLRILLSCVHPFVLFSLFFGRRHHPPFDFCPAGLRWWHVEERKDVNGEEHGAECRGPKSDKVIRFLTIDKRRPESAGGGGPAGAAGGDSFDGTQSGHEQRVIFRPPRHVIVLSCRLFSAAFNDGNMCVGRLFGRGLWSRHICLIATECASLIFIFHSFVLWDRIAGIGCLSKTILMDICALCFWC